jgi:hypothetical protein
MEKRSFDSFQFLQNEIRTIRKAQKDSEIEGKINVILELQQEFQITFDITRRRGEKKREQNQNREIGEIMETQEKQSKPKDKFLTRYYNSNLIFKTVWRI